MIIVERQTGAPVTREMIERLVERLGRSPDVDGAGVNFAVYSPDLDDACSILEQLAAGHTLP